MSYYYFDLYDVPCEDCNSQVDIEEVLCPIAEEFDDIVRIHLCEECYSSRTKNSKRVNK